MSSSSNGLAPADISGILNIDKPAGLTSHDVVVRVRRLTRQPKVGHAGTLDPMATGVLLLCLGQATRVAEYLMSGRKRYRAVIRLGITTDTYDAEGHVTQTVEPFHLSQDQVVDALDSWQGVIKQVPPPYSAVHHKGQRLYQLARRGVPTQVSPRTIEIYALELVHWECPELTLDVTCSPGTYVRSLAHDLGQMLGVGGHLTALTRLASGRWHLQDAITLEKLQDTVKAGDWITYMHPLDAALQNFERVDLPAKLVRQVSHGQSISLDWSPKTPLVRAYAPDDSLVAVLQPSSESGLWQPKKVFKTAPST